MDVRAGGLNQIMGQGSVRDYYCAWPPNAGYNVSELNDPSCFRVQWYGFPKMQNQLVAARGYRQTTLSIPPGSWIYAVIHHAGDLVFQVQLTDIAADHRLFGTQTPNGLMPGRPFYLPAIYPVVEPGNFNAEVWNPSSEAQRCQIIIAACIPKSKG